jgi:hypothetical protein
MVLALVGIGCVPQPPASQPPRNTNPTNPNYPNNPNNPQPQGSSKSGCNGVSTNGSCVVQSGRQLVRTCNTSTNQLNPDVDCTQMGQVCLYGSGGIAACQPQNSGKGGTGGGTNTGLTCPAGLDFNGVCNGNTVHFCSLQTNKVTDQPCGSGMTCRTDGACGGQGATCCPNSTTGGGSCLPCNGLTFAGTCTDSQTVSYCDGSCKQTATCVGGEACTVVGGDADCRAPTSTGGGNNCGSVTSSGICDPNGDGFYQCLNGQVQFTSCGGCVCDDSIGAPTCVC